LQRHLLRGFAICKPANNSDTQSAHPQQHIATLPGVKGLDIGYISLPFKQHGKLCVDHRWLLGLPCHLAHPAAPGSSNSQWLAFERREPDDRSRVRWYRPLGWLLKLQALLPKGFPGSAARWQSWR